MVATGEGKLYLCAIKDVYSGRIVGHSIDERMKASLAVTALHNAIALLSPAGTVVHSDSKYVRCQVFPGFVTLTPIDSRGYRGVGGVLAAS